MNEYKLQAPKGSISLTEENTKTETITYTSPQILGPDTCLQMMTKKELPNRWQKNKIMRLSWAYSHVSQWLAADWTCVMTACVGLQDNMSQANN